MKIFYFTLLITSFISPLFAQQEVVLPIFFGNDSSAILKLDKSDKTPFVVSYPKGIIINSDIELELSFEKKSILIPTKTEKTTDENTGKTTIFGELSTPIFTKETEGYLQFGKALLAALDTINSDSTITVSVKGLANPSIQGVLHLNFKNWSEINQDLWSEIDYYWLLDKQEIIEDSIRILTADNDRGRALLVATTGLVEAANKKKEEGEKELSKKYSQYSSTYESIKKIYTRLDEAFEKTKIGLILTEDEKKQIAFLTSDVSKLKKELKEKPDGSLALEIFEQVSKSQSLHRLAKKQYSDALAESKMREEKLTLCKNKLAVIKQDIKSLKKALKL